MDDSSQDPASINRGDQVRHASDDARAAAKAKMMAALKAQEDGEEVQAMDAGIEATKEDAKVSGVTMAPLKESGLGKEVDESLISQVKVYSPYKTYFDGEARSVSAENDTGPFDILAGHKDFMSLLTKSNIIIRSDRGEETITIERGIVHVRNNTVTVFLDV